MKHLIIAPLFLGLLLISACADHNKVAENNTALIKRFVTSVEELNYDLMESFYAEDYLGIGPSHGDSINKSDAVANWKYNAENLYEKIEYKLSRNIAVTIDSGEGKGDWVSNWAELDITYKNDGGHVTIYANTLYKIENGLIVKSFTLYNEADALRQLGYQIIKAD